ncbi:DeoR family fructose operon transcriptional repressor [Paenibacillus sediminis]|uniref:DeoR family fructose operon transcriptional repressor n=2 Tax=Paenibacillus sediminis TaxID=664909 RepID=A0ABS4H477_9BACL|nr:DeoR family fructose operon transcriptional repressor [Paenibacillus sediminis]
MLYVNEHQRASVQELGEVFQVSESTVRRDLKELEESNLLKRTHGGAVSLQNVNFEPSVIEKEDQFREEKMEIARKACEMISEGDTVLLDAGTTTLHLAREMRSLSNVRVITNSMIVLNELKDYRGLELSMVGGLLRYETLAFVGPMAETALEMVRVDKAFVATNGLDLEEGITTPNIIEAATKRKMFQIAKEVILLADHSKIGKVGYAKVADLSEIDHLIIDAGANDHFIDQLRKQGVSVTIA